MARKIIKHKALTASEYNLVSDKHPLLDLSLNTGARIAEIKRLIDKWEPGMDYVDIKTKKSNGQENRFYLNDKAIRVLGELQNLKGLSEKTLQRRYKMLSKKLGVKFTSHNLRSTFATRLLEMGVDLVTVQHLMNHADISQTAQYIVFVESRYRTATQILTEYEMLEGMTIHDAYNEIVKLRERLARLSNENTRLQTRVAELEKEKQVWNSIHQSEISHLSSH